MELLGKYVVIETEAQVVRVLFTRYAAGGSSLTDLCRWLNCEGVPTPGKAREWHISTLRYLLANPVYKGQAWYGRFDHATDESRLTQTDPQTGRLLRTLKFRRAADPATWISWEVPALVSEEVWEAVTRCAFENRGSVGQSQAGPNALRARRLPLLRRRHDVQHARQARRADGTTHVNPPRYVCTHYRQSIAHTGQQGCQPDTYCVPHVEAAVTLALLEACQKPESIQAALAAYARQQQSPTPTTDPRKEIAAIDKALHSLQRAAGGDG